MLVRPEMTVGSPSQTRREATAVALALVGAIAVFTMWLADAAPITSSGTALTAAGRVTGLEGTYATLLVVLLLARVPWLDRFLGLDRLAAWHRWVGQAAISLLTAHAVLIVWGYAQDLHRPLPAETSTVVLDLPDMLMATVALGILLVVGAVSVRAVRRRVSYEAWYFVHLYTYLALALSFAHQFATGEDFATRPINRVVWAGGYLAVFALLGWYRVGAPLRAHRRHRLRVGAVIPEADGYVSVHVAGRDLAALGAESGQFFIWRFLDRERWWEAHPFSLSAPPADNELRLTVRAAGDFTESLGSVRPGTPVVAEGPFGSFTARRKEGRRSLLIAGGSGIGPIRALFETVPSDAGAPVLLYQVGEATSLALIDDLEAIATTRGARLVTLVGHRHERRELFDPAYLRDILGDDIDQYDVFLCGPRGFMELVEGSLRRAGVPRRRINVERFDL